MKFFQSTSTDRDAASRFGEGPRDAGSDARAATCNGNDFSFQTAAKNGVRAHHWRFGDMQPVPGVTEKQVEWIVKYVREIQRANGIN